MNFRQFNRARAAFVVASLLWAQVAFAHPLVAQVAGIYGLDERLLSAVLMTESRGHPWTLNVQGESFFLGSREEAAALVKHVQVNPWLVRYRPRSGGGPVRWFLPTERAAKLHASTLPADRTSVRRVNPRMIDIGLMQINLHYHGDRMPSIERALDPDWNLSYGAYYLASLIRRHGSIARGLGYYNASDPTKRMIYSKTVLANYERLGPG